MISACTSCCNGQRQRPHPSWPSQTVQILECRCWQLSTAGDGLHTPRRGWQAGMQACKRGRCGRWQVPTRQTGDGEQDPGKVRRGLGPDASRRTIPSPLPAFPGPLCWWCCGLALDQEAWPAWATWPDPVPFWATPLQLVGATSRHCGMLPPGAAARSHTIPAHLTSQSKPPSNHNLRNTGTGVALIRDGSQGRNRNRVG